jgi:hypothetical protein
MDRDELRRTIDTWVHEGLISPEQAEALLQHEAAAAAEPRPGGRVRADEILVYLGSLVIFLALAFLVGLNWQALGRGGRIASVWVPTLLMLGLGAGLRRAGSARLLRGAQALLLAGCLLSALAWGVLFDEFTLIGEETLLVLTSSLLALALAGAIFAVLPRVAQSVAVHLCGSAALVALLAWLDNQFPRDANFYQALSIQATCLVVGMAWLALSRWRAVQADGGLVTVARLFGALTILAGTFSAATSYYPPGRTMGWPWQKALLEFTTFLACLAFIVTGVRRQSLVYLYAGAAFLLFLITYVNFEHFADEIGMPVALFIVGVLLVGLGLGTDRLRRRIRAAP